MKDITPEQEKHALRSKTVQVNAWAIIILALLPSFFPPLKEIIAQFPAAFVVGVMGVINILLRMVTNCGIYVRNRVSK